VAAEADGARIGLYALLRRRVLGVSGEGAVAGFAADPGVLAAGQRFADVRMALDARPAPGVPECAGAVVRQGTGPEMAVDAEVVGDEQAPQNEKRQQARREEARNPDQVLGVAE
jgi:hypothetical protein